MADPGTQKTRIHLYNMHQIFQFQSGIKVCSTESRSEAPLIEVRSTEAFLLNWGDAQTWLGQLLVGYEFIKTYYTLSLLILVFCAVFNSDA